MKTNAEKLPSPWVSAIPLAVLTGLLYVVIRAFGGEAINGGSQIALLSATSVCVMLSIGIYRCRWAVLEEAIIVGTTPEIIHVPAMAPISSRMTMADAEARMLSMMASSSTAQRHR